MECGKINKYIHTYFCGHFVKYRLFHSINTSYILLTLSLSSCVCHIFCDSKFGIRVPV